MPSYKLYASVKWDLQREVDRLCGIHAETVEGGMPLEVDHIIRATMPEHLLAHIRALEAVGKQFTTTRGVNAVIEAVPGYTDRGVVLRFELHKSVPFIWDEQFVTSFMDHRFVNRHGSEKNTFSCRLPFDAGQLEPELREKFNLWLKQALLQRRRAIAAKDLANEFIEHHCNSTAELLTRWRGLRVLFRNLGEPWKSRINHEPTRQMSRWGWTYAELKTIEWYNKNILRIPAADAMIQGAVLFDKGRGVPENPVASTTPTARIVMWDKQPTEPKPNSTISLQEVA